MADSGLTQSPDTFRTDGVYAGVFIFLITAVLPLAFYGIAYEVLMSEDDRRYGNYQQVDDAWLTFVLCLAVVTAGLSAAIFRGPSAWRGVAHGAAWGLGFMYASHIVLALSQTT